MKTQKGFTLFTALISLLLVSISLALIFNMINTEETYLSLIQDQSSMSDLMTVADIARADAFNTFIINLRSSWEEHKSKPNNELRLNRQDIDKNWSAFVDSFVKEKFFERKFAAYFAQALLFNLKYSQYPPGYNIKIEEHTGYRIDNYGRPIDVDDENKFDILVERIFKDGGEKVDVVDCNTVDNCIGSFYLTLDTTKLDDANYELLPVVTVVKYKTKQVIQRPVLSRQIYKIYMPWRGFQALRVARNIVRDNNAERSSSPGQHPQDKGLFNPIKHNIFEQARLGFCDPGTCAPRTSFFKTPNVSGVLDEQCHEIPDQQIESDTLSNIQTPPAQTYNVYAPTLNEQFTTLYVSDFNYTLNERQNERITYGNGLDLESNKIYGSQQLKIKEIKAITERKRTKRFVTAMTDTLPTYQQKIFSRIENMPTVAGGLGLFWNDTLNISELIWFKNHDFYNENYNLQVTIDNTQESATLGCVELHSTEIKLEFKETDPRYKIKDTYHGNTKTRIHVFIYDTYTPFYFPPNNNWSQLTVNTTTGYLTAENLTSANPDSPEWICYSQVSPDDSPGCSPESN